MFKKLFLLLFATATLITAKAQTADELQNAYYDFSYAYVQHFNANALSLGEALLPNAGKLSDKAQPNFYYRMGTLYEDLNQFDKAINCYEKVIAAVPDFFVAHRALGYLYLKQANQVAGKLNAAKTDPVENKRLAALYTATAKKAIPHLEKAQACDPEDDTLTRIKMLYKNTKDEKGLASLDTRLQTLSKNCVDLLSDK
ncbi:tetratricopeptide repeat protein [Mucilaginibacter jinjuensis]|uniref:Tetratricopeptide repeat protein n=1 Tax=Mucilaginibacter jinjuensis TaxID=1176721 RepID=A0ABY7T884_9SPHI|nr:tetratricopeptide repeat protein [Mucilaginibacter jinjuensis]WCT12483.1 tetratricopeptide repeat protein [Mucilaginibacter jinjuensis]